MSLLSIPRLAVTISVFFLMLGIANILPHLLNLYRERYIANLIKTTRELNKFFITIKPSRIIIGAMVLGALLGLATGSWVLAGAFALTGILAPRVVLAIWKDIRSTQFEAQLMDALLQMGNALRSGMDIAAGIELVATNLKPPISEEFGLVLNAYRLGAPLEEALLEMTTRIKSRTLETVVYAINIQRESGGNIIKTFEQLVITIREESKLQKKVSAITSQARTQIYFMAVFPWCIGLLLFVLNRDLMLPALENPIGQVIVLVLIIWEALGILVTKKMAMVKV